MLQREHHAILSTFIKLPFVIKLFVLSIFEWPPKTVFTILNMIITSGLVYSKKISLFHLKSECCMLHKAPCRPKKYEVINDISNVMNILYLIGRNF